MKARHLLMAIAAIIAAWLAMFGDKTPSAPFGVTEAITRNTLTASASSSAKNMSSTLDNTDLRKSVEKSSKKSGYLPSISTLIKRDALFGSNGMEKTTAQLFGSQSWTPAPPPPEKLKPLPPPAPVAPPLPYTFLGKKIEDGLWEVYLARNDLTFIVRAKTVIESNYRIDDIKPPVLTLTYLPLNQIQTLTIGEAD